MTTIYLLLGSNIGDKEKNIHKAIELLKYKNILTIKKISSLYKTEPVDLEQQDWFLNCAVEAETKLDLEGLFKFTLDIEKKLGKDVKIRFGPRIIDIDILFFGDEIKNIEIIVTKVNKDKKSDKKNNRSDKNNHESDNSEDKYLVQVPHPRLHTRKFVLVPMNEIAAKVKHPLLNKTIKELLANLDKQNAAKKVELWKKS